MESKLNFKRNVPIQDNEQAVFPYGKYGFPCELYNDNIDDFQNSTIDAHWQLELEFSVIEKGTLELQIQDHVIHVTENQGYVIFPHTIHKVQKCGTSNGIYKTIIAAPRFLYGDSASVLFYKYYLPVLAAIPQGFILLEKNGNTQEHILDGICEVVRLLENRPAKYELDIYRAFIGIWSQIYDLVQNLRPNRTFSSKDEDVIQQMLLFIHANYTDDISLTDISYSGNISKSECYRIFQRTMSCTPIDYLVNYRLSKSQELLADDSLTITEVAIRSGFNSVNYYTTVFKKHIGYTPSQFKKLLKENF